MQTKKTHLPLLLVDRMLGKLSRYLRMAGYDAIYLREEIDQVKEARRMRRILITRDKIALSRCQKLHIPCIEVFDNYPEKQFEEVLGKLGSFGKPLPYSRCIKCNEPLEKILDKKLVEGWVPPFVYKTQEQFKRCPACGRIFWKGTHRKKMDEIIEKSWHGSKIGLDKSSPYKK